jgi:hypothetical protein
MAEETNHNDAGEVAPSTVDQQAPSVSEEHAPSTDSDVATDIPSASAPDPKTANPDVNPNAAGEKPTAEAQVATNSSQTAVEEPAVSAKDTAEDKAAKLAAKKAAAKPKDDEGAADADKPANKAKGDEAPAKAAKKDKAPAVEDKPFAEFIQQHYLPALQKALESQGVQELKLTFEKQKIPVRGYEREPECWQVIGRWQGGLRQFQVYFFKEDIQGQRAFSYAENRGRPSTMEPFLIDERKVTLDLLVFGAIQRLNAQKWLVRN